MTKFISVQVPFGDARNPRGFAISSDGMRFCGTFPVTTIGMEDYASGYLVSWSPPGLYHIDRKEDQRYVGISCRGVNRAGDVVGFATLRTVLTGGAHGATSTRFQSFPFFWPAHEPPVVFQFADAKNESHARPGMGTVDGLFGINDRGEVVGQYVDKKKATIAYVATVSALLADPTAANPATLTRLSMIRATGPATRGPAPLSPRGINNKGFIVGSIQGEGIGFVTPDRTNYVTVMVNNVETAVNGINDEGEIVGNFQPSSNESHGFRWHIDANGQITGPSEQVDYPTPDFPGKQNLRTTLNGIDNSGTAIGYLTYDDMWNQVEDENGVWGNETRIQPFLQRGGWRATLTNEMKLTDAFEIFR